MFEAASYNNFRDILITSFQCPNLERAITQKWEFIGKKNLYFSPFYFFWTIEISCPVEHNFFFFFFFFFTSGPGSFRLPQYFWLWMVKLLFPKFNRSLALTSERLKNPWIIYRFRTARFKLIIHCMGESFRIIPEFRIMRLTFHKKVILKMLK